MKWWDQMPWSSFFEYWVLSQLFHSPLSLSRGSLVPPCFLPCIHVIKPLCDFSFANLSRVKLTQIRQKNPAAQKETSSSWLEQPHYDFSPFYNQYIYFGFSLGFLIPCSLLWLCSLAKKVLLSVVCILKRIIFFSSFIQYIHAQSLSCVWLFATPWIVACQLLCPWNFPGTNTGVGGHIHSRRSSWSWNRTHISWVSCICRWILYHWATRKAILYKMLLQTWSISQPHVLLLETDFSLTLCFGAHQGEWVRLSLIMEWNLISKAILQNSPASQDTAHHERVPHFWVFCELTGSH